ncbi:MAG: glycosyltransferase family 4 protein [Chitinophagales bacterium]|nr:glycosyltransferase family 4 protein [Chitinophagales bacterium]MDW8418250.1 glycosyltransferase family 1 protein [Chitinophagales bacterium]
MKIAFDAKRALNNHTGLGVYARALLSGMFSEFPEHEYFLFSPKADEHLLQQLQGAFKLCLPQGLINRIFPALWRSVGANPQLRSLRTDIYHGLSNELPFAVHRHTRAAVVTIHDLIFLKNPEQYFVADRIIYHIKTRYAAKCAAKIIAVSNETKKDLIERYKISDEKIEVIYPAADTRFEVPVTADEIQRVKSKYNLPQRYLLHVGAFFPRKNHIRLLDAFHKIHRDTDAMLVLAGYGGFMLRKVQEHTAHLGLTNRVVILNRVHGDDLPALYAGSEMMVYPCLYEGFGIPVLEAMWQQAPVITTACSAMAEAAGGHALLVNPYEVDDLADNILQLLQNERLRNKLKQDGFQHAKNFSSKNLAARTMQVYRELTG